MASDPDSPEQVVQAFEAAYVRGDADAAVEAWDFDEAGRLAVQAYQAFIPAPEIEGLKGPTWAQSEGTNLKRLLRLLLDQLHRKVPARFEIWKCSLAREGWAVGSAGSVGLIESCDAGGGQVYPQELIVRLGPKGWRLVQYLSWQTYKPVCYTDTTCAIVVCSERDGQHVNAVKNGQQLWRRDSVADWNLWAYRTLYPVVYMMEPIPQK